MTSVVGDTFEQTVSGDLSGRLSLGRARFLDPATESRFQAWQFANLRRVMIFGLGILCLIAAANLAVDFSYQRGAAVSTQTLLLRLVQMLASAVTLAALARAPDVARTRHLFEVFVVTFLSLGLWQILSHPQYHFIGPVTQIGTTFSIYLLVSFPWLRQTGYALAFSLLGLWGWYHKLGPVADFFHIGLWLFFANALGAFVARQRHLHERLLFAAGDALTGQLDAERQLRRQHAGLVDLITHELRNPLAAIQTQAELIQSTSTQAGVRSLAEKITAISTRSARLISNWVAGDRLAQDDPQTPAAETTPPLNDALSRVLADFRHKHPGYLVNLPANPLPPLLIAPHVLAIAFSNLLDNAAKYAPSERGIHVQYRIGARRVMIRVRDFGPGIAPLDQEKVFIKHQRLGGDTSTQEGTGVGLYLVREMLERCGASIRLQSQSGRGSAFIIEVPRL